MSLRSINIFIRRLCIETESSSAETRAEHPAIFFSALFDSRDNRVAFCFSSFPRSKMRCDKRFDNAAEKIERGKEREREKNCTLSCQGRTTGPVRYRVSKRGIEYRVRGYSLSRNDVPFAVVLSVRIYRIFFQRF